MFGAVSTSALRGTDAALVVGTYLFPEVFPDLDDPLRDAAVVHVDLDAYEIGKNHPVDLGLVADPRLTLAALAERLRERRTAAKARAAAARLERRRTEAADRTEPDGPGLLVSFLRELSAALPADTVVFDEGITASPFIGRHLPGRRPGSSYLSRGGSLGVGVPGALGIQVAHPGRTVLAFTGDGGAMYTIQALWTAARHGLPVKVVVCNNHRYQLLDDNLDQYWRERAISGRGYPGSFGLAGPDLDFVGLARALGADGATVGKQEDVGPGVLALLSADGPFLVDLATDDPQGGSR
jgi:benzoylformate decarboxylase